MTDASADDRLRPPSRLIAREDDGFRVECPVCGFECVHPEVVSVNAGGSITTVDHRGTRMTVGGPSGRGVLITLSFFCEDGHRFSVDFQFHKGITGASVSAGAPHDPERGDFPRAIWRD